MNQQSLSVDVRNDILDFHHLYSLSCTNMYNACKLAYKISLKNRAMLEEYVIKNMNLSKPTLSKLIKAGEVAEKLEAKNIDSPTDYTRLYELKDVAPVIEDFNKHIEKPIKDMSQREIKSAVKSFYMEDTDKKPNKATSVELPILWDELEDAILDGDIKQALAAFNRLKKEVLKNEKRHDTGEDA